MRRPQAFALVCWLAVPVLLTAAQTIQVTPVAREGRVYVSFRLSDAFTDDLKETIHSGLATTFNYDVDLKRGSAFWFDRSIASATVSASVKYDTLTRKYSVTRSYDGRIGSADTTDNEEIVRGWLTEFDKLPLFSSAPLEANVEYYLRVRAHTTPRTAWFFLPWDRHEVAGTAKFTFIP